MVFDPDDFKILPGFFDHPSRLHGASHTWRVMTHVLIIGRNLPSEVLRPAFFGAFIHDMARQHDGYCSQHGEDAAATKPEMFSDLFARYKLSPKEFEAMKCAVTFHSLPVEPGNDHPHHLCISLLKDADALDRIRMGPLNLNPAYLRLEESRRLIRFSHRLYYRTCLIRSLSFARVLSVAGKCLGRKVEGWQPSTASG